MEIKVKKNYARISPTKVRPVLYGLVGLSAVEARNKLIFVNKKAAPILAALITSAIAIAKENYIEEDKLLIKEIFCNQGPRLKRMQPWSKGVGRRIVKKMSNITLVVDSGEDNQKKPRKTKTDKDIKSNEES